MVYTPTGPFNPGGAPGMSAAYGNNLENWIKGIDNLTPITLNGSTSGTAKLYQFLQGNSTNGWKFTLVLFSNFRNGGGSLQTIALPQAYSTGCQWGTGNSPPGSLTSSGAAQSLNIITGLSAGGGSITVQTQWVSYAFGESMAAWDTLSFNSGQATARTGIAWFSGI